MKPAILNFLARLDGRLSIALDPQERIRLIDDERHRVDRAERALSEWSARESNCPAPTRFSAFDLAILHGELTLRMERACEDETAFVPSFSGKPEGATD
ncbi:hypothetical protein [Methylocystis heyeri]|uniref:Uncharacterized protein n=1 Tax=Methylocystis heyeri TaxID=391905 RepID=A0A6B8KH44_9HYPH|nr:hypothetical protein [Methylocystis heyeri]QGM45803.1 hypothetical protein H2LOC_008855 [Methylocystis heyeri]